MKKLLASLALGLTLCFGGAAFAQTAPAAEAKVEAKAEAAAPATAPAAAPDLPTRGPAGSDPHLPRVPRLRRLGFHVVAQTAATGPDLRKTSLDARG